MRFVKYGVETWKCELGNKRRSVNYELFLKNSKKRSKSYKLSKLCQRKLCQLHPLRQLNRKSRNHDNPARTSPHSLEPAKSAQPRSLQAKPSSNIYQTASPLDAQNATLRSPRILPSTSTFGDVVVRKIQTGIRIQMKAKRSKRIRKSCQKNRIFPDFLGLFSGNFPAISFEYPQAFWTPFESHLSLVKPYHFSLFGVTPEP
jgi:hypothetical protein